MSATGARPAAGIDSLAGAPGDAACGPLFYVVGPSGAGKDSLLGWLCRHAPPEAALHVARRTITRASRPGDDAHLGVTPDEFARRRAAGRFAFHWRANGHDYGVEHDELAPLRRGACVLVNGSRGHLPEALRQRPSLHIVHVTASSETLRRRLVARGREDAPAIEARVARAAAFVAPTGAIEVRNDGRLDAAGERLWAAIGSVLGIVGTAR